MLRQNDPRVFHLEVSIMGIEITQGASNRTFYKLKTHGSLNR